MMTSTRALLASSLVLGAVLLGACGGDEDTASDDVADEATEQTTSTTEPAAPAGGDAVTIEQSRFAPDPLEVPTGTEVTFENLDPYAHTVTAAEGSAAAFDSGEIAQDETFSQTFDDAGTYEYVCEIHPTMRAEVVVG